MAYHGSYDKTFSPLCPVNRGYPVSCPGPSDPPHYTVCCRDQHTPACCSPRAHTVCAFRGHGPHRVEGEFAYDPGQNWTTKWCPDSDTTYGCCYSSTGVDCCNIRFGYTHFWWGTMIIALGLFLYLCMRRRNQNCSKPSSHPSWPPTTPEPQLIPLQEIPPSSQPWSHGQNNTPWAWSNQANQGGEDTLFDQSQIGRAPARPVAPPAYDDNSQSGGTVAGTQREAEQTEAPPSYESVVNEGNRRTGQTNVT